jgi:hypothetical protein
MASPPDMTQMHAYGVEFNLSTVTFFIDRVQIAQWPMPSGYSNNMFWIMNYGNNADQGGGAVPTSSLPCFGQVDYVGYWPTGKRPF